MKRNVTLLENAFKHGGLCGLSSTLDIHTGLVFEGLHDAFKSGVAWCKIK
jgi:hypothetical protein